MPATKNSTAAFDRACLNVLSFLDNHKHVVGVQLVENTGARPAQVTRWQLDNQPCLLPSDLESFLALTDGLLIRWQLQFQAETTSLGCMHVNALSKLQRIDARHLNTPVARKSLKHPPPSPSLALADAGNDEDSADDESDDELQAGRRSPSRTSKAVPRLPCAFDLDSMTQDGRVALMYRESYSNPEVWFQDLSCKWYFVAHSFTEYFRLLIFHLGIPRWQYVFTDVGIDPVAQQWLRFMVPERLTLDQQLRKSLLSTRAHAVDMNITGFDLNTSLRGHSSKRVATSGTEQEEAEMKELQDAYQAAQQEISLASVHKMASSALRNAVGKRSRTPRPVKASSDAPTSSRSKLPAKQEKDKESLPDAAPRKSSSDASGSSKKRVVPRRMHSGPDVAGNSSSTRARTRSAYNRSSSSLGNSMGLVGKGAPIKSSRSSSSIHRPLSSSTLASVARLAAGHRAMSTSAFPPAASRSHGLLRRMKSANGKVPSRTPSYARARSARR